MTTHGLKPNLRSRIQHWAPDWRTVFSAALIVAAFPPWDLWPLIWICLIPWFAALERAKTPRLAVREGFWLGFLMSVGGFYWVGFVLQEFANLPWVLSVLGLLLFSCFGQPQFMVYAALSKVSRPYTHLRLTWQGTAIAAIMALAYTGIDWILPKLFIDTLGHSLYKAQALRQIADLGTATLLTFLIFLVNDTLWSVLKQVRKHRHIRLWPQALLTLVLLSVGWKYGHDRLEFIRQKITAAPKGVQAAAIQGNIGDFDKIAAERGIAGAAVKVLFTFMELTDKALQMNPRPEVIIWPETSFPSTFRNPNSTLERDLDQRLEEFVRTRKIQLFFGGYDHFQGKDFNALFLLGPDGRLQVYRKNILLLFGEYIPGADYFPFIKRAFPQVGNFGRGEGPITLPLELPDTQRGSIITGPIICYEALFPGYLTESAKNGSELIVNITNDSWFGKWGEPQLHLALTVFRSIETRLPMIRTTNTGISALILPDGEITSATELDQQRIMNVYVPIAEQVSTIVKTWGDWFGKTALLLGLLGLGWLRYRHHRQTGRKAAHSE